VSLQWKFTRKNRLLKKLVGAIGFELEPIWGRLSRQAKSRAPARDLNHDDQLGGNWSGRADLKRASRARGRPSHGFFSASPLRSDARNLGCFVGRLKPKSECCRLNADC
jgi:hypothetical protein